MQRTLIFLIALASTLAFAADLPQRSAAQIEKPTIKIGVVCPLTGSNAYMGQQGKAGLEMRLKEISANSKFNYQIIYEDDGFVFSRTASAIQKLKNIDRVDALMTMWGYGSDIALPILKGSQILHLSVERWTPGRGNLDFVAGSSLELNVKTFLELLTQVGYKRVAYIGTADGGEEMYRKALIKELPAHGIELVNSTVLSTDVRDLRTWILKTKEAKAELIIECAAVPVGGILMKQMQELGVKTPVGHITSSSFEIEPAYTEGQWLVLASPPTDDWATRFQSQFNKPGRYPAPQFYNTLAMFIAGTERLEGSRKPTTIEIADSLRAMKSFEGSTGTLEFSAPNRYEASVSYYVFHKGNASPKPLKEILATQKN